MAGKLLANILTVHSHHLISDNNTPARGCLDITLVLHVRVSVCVSVCLRVCVRADFAQLTEAGAQQGESCQEGTLCSLSAVLQPFTY